jgi:hypothetical protein
MFIRQQAALDCELMEHASFGELRSNVRPRLRPWIEESVLPWKWFLRRQGLAVEEFLNERRLLFGVSSKKYRHAYRQFPYVENVQGLAYQDLEPLRPVHGSLDSGPR